MSVHDGLLSFQIKETIFLSSDKANIGEMKELELIPDVEIIENKNEISITGCLQLHGRYEPVRNAQASQAGESDSLLEAMKFTPFQLQDEESRRFLYAQDVELVHRIPLNVSIPLSRIDELDEIYAIVDSFDYEVKTPHQLQIQADLKISGIHLKSHETTKSGEPITPVGGSVQESWEFVHAANSLQEENQPTNIEEIEHKLAELEREVEAREQSYQALQQPPAPFAPSPFTSAPYTPTPFAQTPYTPSAAPFTQAPYTSSPAPFTQAPYTSSPYMGEQVQHQSYVKPPSPLTYNPVQPTQSAPVQDEPVRTVHGTPVGYQQGDEAAIQAEHPTELQFSAQQANEAETVAEPEANPEANPEAAVAPEVDAVVETQAVPEHNDAHYREQDKIIDFQTAYDERQLELLEDQDVAEAVEPASDAEDSEIEEVEAEPEETVETIAQAEAKEMKVAIGSKPSPEKESGLSITSLFTQGGRPKTEQAVEERYRDSSEAVSREIDETVKAKASELRSSLSSFVRENDQQFSRLKMCIIQKEETIQSIADRYELPVSKLLEVNRLSTDRITKGQVLYIPQ